MVNGGVMAEREICGVGVVLVILCVSVSVGAQDQAVSASPHPFHRPHLSAMPLALRSLHYGEVVRLILLAICLAVWPEIWLVI